MSAIFFLFVFGIRLVCNFYFPSNESAFAFLKIKGVNAHLRNQAVPFLSIFELRCNICRSIKYRGKIGKEKIK